MRGGRKVPVLFARLAVCGVAVLLAAGFVTAARSPPARASSLSSVTDFPVPGSDPWVG